MTGHLRASLYPEGYRHAFLSLMACYCWQIKGGRGPEPSPLLLVMALNKRLLSTRYHLNTRTLGKACTHTCITQIRKPAEQILRIIMLEKGRQADMACLETHDPPSLLGFL